MKIGGFGELESVRKSLQKEDRRSPSEKSKAEGAPARSGDAVQISAEAQVLGKLRKVPDVRKNEIERILAKVNDGTLMTPDAVKESISNMLKHIL